jgi:hypothetical protein
MSKVHGCTQATWVQPEMPAGARAGSQLESRVLVYTLAREAAMMGPWLHQFQASGASKYGNQVCNLGR